MRPNAKDRNIRREMLPTEREVLLARMLLWVCDELGNQDPDQEFIELYNRIKAIAEPIVRGGN